MIARTEQTLGLKPDRLVADTACGTGRVGEAMFKKRVLATSVSSDPTSL